MDQFQGGEIFSADASLPQDSASSELVPSSGELTKSNDVPSDTAINAMGEQVANDVMRYLASVEDIDDGFAGLAEADPNAETVTGALGMESPDGSVEKDNPAESQADDKQQKEEDVESNEDDKQSVELTSVETKEEQTAPHSVEQMRSAVMNFLESNPDILALLQNIDSLNKDERSVIKKLIAGKVKRIIIEMDESEEKDWLDLILLILEKIVDGKISVFKSSSSDVTNVPNAA